MNLHALGIWAAEIVKPEKVDKKDTMAELTSWVT